ncbi:MAG: hypothetical protein WBP81_20795 [Solirubrobacteraceae bacterium]
MADVPLASRVRVRRVAHRRSPADLTPCRTGWRGDVCEQVDQPHDGVLIALNGRPFVVGERDLDQHPLDAVFGFERLRFAGGLRHVEVAAGARHPVRAPLEEAVEQ